MPATLNEYISREKVRRDLRRKIKENTVLNEVHDFIGKANIDQELILYIRANHQTYHSIYSELILYIRTNHQTYHSIYSTLINTIYYFINEEPIQNQFIQGFTMWQTDTQGGWLSLPQPPTIPQRCCRTETNRLLQRSR